MSNRYYYLFLASNVLIILDQYTKMLVNKYIPQGHFIMVIDNLFALTHIRNPGVAFGIGADWSSELKVYLLVGFTIIAITAILIIFHKAPRENKMVQVALILIFSGAIGNLIDRVLYHEVIDFLDFFYNHHHWPAFNVADSCITFGVALMIMDLIRSGQVPQVDDSSDSPEST